MKLKIFLAFVAGIVAGGLFGFSLWWTPPPKPPAPSLALQPAKTSAAAKDQAPKEAYYFEVNGAQCYYDSNGRFSIAPFKDKQSAITIVNKGEKEVDISISGKPRAVFTVHMVESRIQSFSLENGNPGDRVTHFDLAADGVYDFVDVDKEGKKASEVYVEGRWYSYMSEGGRHYVDFDGQLREIIPASTGVHFKAADESSQGAEIP